MATFRINYNQVISQANAIKDKSADIKNQISNIEQMEQIAKSSWQGLAANAFLKQIDSLKQDMNNTYRIAVNLSDTIKNVATRIQREDEAAAERAKQLLNAKKNKININ